MLGEVGLDGTISPVRGIIGKLLAARGKGITTFYIPEPNLRQAQLVPSVTLIPINELAGLYQYLCNLVSIKPVHTRGGIFEAAQKEITAREISEPVLLSGIVGQQQEQQVKRALPIAAAGAHNVFFSGPTGASALSVATPEPRVTHLHSLAGHEYDQIISERPFRSPHHSTSHVAIIGGGNNLRPSEISLSHKGSCSLTNCRSSTRLTLEALRQPLEDQQDNRASPHR